MEGLALHTKAMAMNPFIGAPRAIAEEIEYKKPVGFCGANCSSKAKLFCKNAVYIVQKRLASPQAPPDFGRSKTLETAIAIEQAEQKFCGKIRWNYVGPAKIWLPVSAKPVLPKSGVHMSRREAKDGGSVLRQTYLAPWGQSIPDELNGPKIALMKSQNDLWLSNWETAIRGE